MVLAGPNMATLTIRNVKPAIVKSLKARARRKGRSMSQEVRELLEEHIPPVVDKAERLKVLEEIRRSWASQSRPTTPEEIESWIQYGRE